MGRYWSNPSLHWFVCFHPISREKKTDTRNENYFSHRMRPDMFASRMRGKIFMGNVRLSVFIRCQCFIITVFFTSFILRLSLAWLQFYCNTMHGGGQSAESHKILCGTDAKYHKWEMRASRWNYNEQIVRKKCEKSENTLAAGVCEFCFLFRIPNKRQHQCTRILHQCWMPEFIWTMYFIIWRFRNDSGNPLTLRWTKWVNETIVMCIR